MTTSFFVPPAGDLVNRHFGPDQGPFGKQVIGMPGALVEHRGRMGFCGRCEGCAHESRARALVRRSTPAPPASSPAIVTMSEPITRMGLTAGIAEDRLCLPQGNPWYRDAHPVRAWPILATGFTLLSLTTVRAPPPRWFRWHSRRGPRCNGADLAHCRTRLSVHDRREAQDARG